MTHMLSPLVLAHYVVESISKTMTSHIHLNYFLHTGNNIKYQVKHIERADWTNCLEDRKKTKQNYLVGPI